MIHLDSSLQYTLAGVNYSKIQLESESEYMKERYKKIHNIKYEEGLNTGTATHIRVYRNEGQNLVGIHPFLMSNLEGILVFFHFFVNSRLLRGTVKILVEVIQFPVKVSAFFFGSFISFL